MRVLIAEDDADLRQSLSVVRQLGHDVVVVASGPKAIGAQQPGRTRAGVLDCEMPEFGSLGQSATEQASRPGRDLPNGVHGEQTQAAHGPVAACLVSTT